jgi:hypothetical protein
MNRPPFDPENRFQRAYLDHVEQSSRFSDRFGSTRSDYAVPRSDNDRFECLRSDYVAPRSTATNSFFERAQERQDKVYYMPSTKKSQESSEQTETTIPKQSSLQKLSEMASQPIRPPGLSSPIQKRKQLSIDSEEQFPSLLGSPKTPKTPKKLIEPLREEIEFIPLPKPRSTSVSNFSSERSLQVKNSEESESEQLYRVIRTISGGSWSDRVKYFGPAEGEPLEEKMNYDEDGFPMIKDIEDMVNTFT